MAEHKNSAERRDADDEKDHGWRRAASSDSLGMIGAFGGAAQAIGEFAAHASPEGGIGVVLTALSVAHALKVRAEKKAERNR
jgi:hypothetical protein